MPHPDITNLETYGIRKIADGQYITIALFAIQRPSGAYLLDSRGEIATFVSAAGARMYADSEDVDEPSDLHVVRYR